MSFPNIAEFGDAMTNLRGSDPLCASRSPGETPLDFKDGGARKV